MALSASGRLFSLMSDDFTKPLTQQKSPETLVVADLDLPARFQVEQSVGGGGMGLVVRAFDLELQNSVAIKVLNECLTSDSDSQQRFLREAKLLAQLEHENIVQFKSFGVTASGRPYQVTELLQGKTLAQRLLEGPLLPSEFKTVFLQIIAGLEFAAAAGVVHRDIKPSNIFLSRTASGELLTKVLDFGIARQDKASGSSEHTLTATSMALGSPLYMSPEQCRGTRVDFRSDIYSLGCVMHECVTGQPPFIGETPLDTMYQHATAPAPLIESADGLSKQLHQLIYKCLSKNPLERPSSYTDLKGVLVQSLQNIDDTRSIKVNAKPSSANDGNRKTRVPLAVFVALIFAVLSASLILKQLTKPLAESDGVMVRLRNNVRQDRDLVAKCTDQNQEMKAFDRLSNSLERLGDHLLSARQPAEAEDCYKECIGLAKRREHPEYEQGKMLVLLGDAIFHSKNRARYGEAEQCFKKSIALLDNCSSGDYGISTHLLTVRIKARTSLATLYAATGRIHNSRESFDDSTPILRTLMDRAPIGTFKKQICNAIGDLAAKCHTEVHNVAEPTTSQDKLDLAAVHLHGAEVLLSVKDSKRSGSLIEWAQHRLDETAGLHLPDWTDLQRRCWQDEAVQEELRGNIRKSKDLLEKAGKL